MPPDGHRPTERAGSGTSGSHGDHRHRSVPERPRAASGRRRRADGSHRLGHLGSLLPARLQVHPGDTPGNGNGTDADVAYRAMGPHHDEPEAWPAASAVGRRNRSLSDDEIGLLEESLRLIEDRSDRVIGYFYAALFVEAPQLRALFPAAMDAQRDRLFRALTGGRARPRRAASGWCRCSRSSAATTASTACAPGHYEVFGRALIASLRKLQRGRLGARARGRLDRGVRPDRRRS